MRILIYILMAPNITKYVGLSYYEIGNYSDSQVWLEEALHLGSKALEDEYTIKQRIMRVEVCLHLFDYGVYFPRACFGVLLKDFTATLSAKIVMFVLEPLYREDEKFQQPKKPLKLVNERETLNKCTDVAVPKKSFVRFKQVDQFMHKVQSTAAAVLSYVYEIVREYSPSPVTVAIFLRLCVVIILMNLLFLVCVSIVVFFIYGILCFRYRALSRYYTCSYYCRYTVLLCLGINPIFFITLFMSYLFGGYKHSDLY